MPDYSKAKIYTIRSYKTNEIYVGSTINPLYKRLGDHKRKYKYFNNGGGNNYITSYKIVKYDDCYIELHENYPCDNREQLNRREGEIIRLLDCVNKQIQGRTIQEYYQDNKEYLAQKKKEYQEDNKEKIKEKRKEYREQNKEHIAEGRKKYYEDNKEHIAERSKEYYKKNKEHIAEYYEMNKENIAEKQKQFYQDNKERILEKAKEYYEENKEKRKKYREENKQQIAQRRAEKITCDICGVEVSRSGYRIHTRSKKHKKNI